MNVFLYGRGARERSEFYWLKASYFTLKFHPHRFITLVTFHDRSPFKKLVPPERFKLPTPCFVGKCSVQTELRWCVGAPRQNRTAITGLQNQCTTIVLVGLIVGLGSRNRTYAPASQTQSDTISPYRESVGCRGRIRTSDLQLMRLAGTTGLPYSAIIFIVMYYHIETHSNGSFRLSLHQPFQPG